MQDKLARTLANFDKLPDSALISGVVVDALFDITPATVTATSSVASSPNPKR
jgi:hypothetical protein